MIINGHEIKLNKRKAKDVLALEKLSKGCEVTNENVFVIWAQVICDSIRVPVYGMMNDIEALEKKISNPLNGFFLHRKIKRLNHEIAEYDIYTPQYIIGNCSADEIFNAFVEVNSLEGVDVKKKLTDQASAPKSQDA